MGWVLVLIISFSGSGVATTQIDFADEESCYAALKKIHGQWLGAIEAQKPDHGQRTLINTCVPKHDPSAQKTSGRWEDHFR